jgi:hypothetical protein
LKCGSRAKRRPIPGGSPVSQRMHATSEVSTLD